MIHDIDAFDGCTCADKTRILRLGILIGNYLVSQYIGSCVSDKLFSDAEESLRISDFGVIDVQIDNKSGNVRFQQMVVVFYDNSGEFGLSR